MSTGFRRFAHGCAALVWVWGCAGGEEVVAAPEPAAAEGPRIIEVPEEVAARTTLSTARVDVVRTGGAIGALAELGVDEHRYALVDAPAPGRVVGLLAHVGDRVEVGTPLVELSSGDVGALRSELASVRTRITTAESRLERRRTLIGERLGNASDFEAAEAELADARAAEGRVLAALRAADARGTSGASRGSGGGGLIVRSPIAGIVLEHHAFPGEAATQDDHLFEISDISSLWLLAHVSEAEASHLSAGTPARVTFPSRPGEVRTVTTALVGDRVSEGSHTVEVRIDIDNADGALRPGMAANVLFLPAGDNEVLLVPRGAVQHPSAGWCVFLSLGDNRYELRRVVRGRELEGEIEILEGLTGGEELVTEGSFLLRSMADAGEWGEE